jgi:hypothetical protein
MIMVVERKQYGADDWVQRFKRPRRREKWEREKTVIIYYNNITRRVRRFKRTYRTVRVVLECSRIIILQYGDNIVTQLLGMGWIC